MPTLNWIGKDAVIEHHKRVPLRLLECDRDLSAGDPEAGNLLIKGDNLEPSKRCFPATKARSSASTSTRRTTREIHDFIVELLDGVIVIVEYKNQKLAGDDEEKHKRAVGEFWEARSAGGMPIRICR